MICLRGYRCSFPNDRHMVGSRGCLPCEEGRLPLFVVHGAQFPSNLAPTGPLRATAFYQMFTLSQSLSSIALGFSCQGTGCNLNLLFPDPPPSLHPLYLYIPRHGKTRVGPTRRRAPEALQAQSPRTANH